jgi:hypothetical protein
VSITALLIGGPKGGEVMVIPDPLLTIRAAVFRPQGFVDDIHAQPTFRSVDYQRVGHGNDWAVYRYQPSAQDVLEDAKRLVEAVEAGWQFANSDEAYREARDFRRIHLGGAK